MTECPASEPYIDAPVFAGATGLSHFVEAAARLRLDRLVGELPIRLPAELRFSGGHSNDGWDLGETFLRVCWRADRDRMIREAMLVDALPADVPHAAVIGCGKTDELSWVLSRRVPGRPLVEVAADLSKLEIRRLFYHAASVLQSLHSWSFPRYIPPLVGDRPRMDLTDPLSVFASDLVLLPLPRILTQLELARRLSHVDPYLIEVVKQKIVDLADVDPFDDALRLAPIIHSDPSLGNWLIDKDA